VGRRHDQHSEYRGVLVGIALQEGGCGHETAVVPAAQQMPPFLGNILQALKKLALRIGVTGWGSRR
jgi:hypothetical protein